MSTTNEIKSIKIIPMYEASGTSLPIGVIIIKTIK